MSKTRHDSHDTDELPIVIEDGGPTAADTHKQIVDGECGQCGYDRIMVTRKYGEAIQQCMLCDASRNSQTDAWSPPTTDSDQLHDDREYADGEGPLERIGRSHRSQFSYDSETYAYDDSAVVRHYTFSRRGSTSLTSLTTDELADIVVALEDDRDFLSDLAEDRLDKQLRPSVPYNPNAVHVGRVAHYFEDRHMGVRILISLQHKTNDMQFIHFPPSDDGIAI